ncbi:O-fucosyltransferase 38-like [Actinidia eriantha]|uniref:O-fucosyltransferase 38-like n=1 Tax=Actinidia eriantha TaxID=165200 RepID=UPI002582D648|nr:O-fucosyltransferase 38-like [Actinidia eriantha]
MRTGISDMVALARIMNATLVIPQLDKRSFWQDSSIFSDVFDELHFIESLKKDVRIVKVLPKELEYVPRARKHFTSWSGMSYYEEMTHLWKDYQVQKSCNVLHLLCLYHRGNFAQYVMLPFL